MKLYKFESKHTLQLSVDSISGLAVISRRFRLFIESSRISLVGNRFSSEYQMYNFKCYNCQSDWDYTLSSWLTSRVPGPVFKIPPNPTGFDYCKLYMVDGARLYNSRRPGCVLTIDGQNNALIVLLNYKKLISPGEVDKEFEWEVK